MSALFELGWFNDPYINMHIKKGKYETDPVNPQ